MLTGSHDKKPTDGLASRFTDPERCNGALHSTHLADTACSLDRSFRRRNATGVIGVSNTPDIPPVELRRDWLGKTMETSTEDQVRAHRVLLHRRTLVERVLPLGATPLNAAVPTPTDVPSHKRRPNHANLLDRLRPVGRASWDDCTVRDDHNPFAERRGSRRDLERSSWMRYLMNVHLMWVD